MNNYNTFIYQIKGGLCNFSSKLSKSLGRVESKFISSVVYGVVKSDSPMLSEIGRALKENIKLKDTIDRLSKNLANIYKRLDVLWSNYHNEIKPKLNSESIMSFDFSDVIKPLGKKFEDLTLVADGSDEHKLKLGYWIAEATVLINDRVVSLYSQVFSTISKGFKSTNDIAFKILDKVYSSFGNIATMVMDRGFDDQKFFKYFVAKTWGFIIRASHINRIVYYDGSKIKLSVLKNEFKGKYSTTIFIKGKNHRVKCSFVKIKVPGIKEELTVIFVYFNKSTSMFITNLDVIGKNSCLDIVYTYYKRWRIEEYFKYKKQCFTFENFRVRDLERINSLNTLMTVALSAIELITRNKTNLLSFILKEANSIKDTVRFEYYRLARGLKSILDHTITGIACFFVTSNIIQLSLFENFAET